MRNRKFILGAWHHIYCITQDGGVLFYRLTDRLAFFTVLAVFARRFKLTVVGLCLMFTHFHMMVLAIDLAQLRAFMQQVLSTFSRILREDRGLKDGSCFRRPFGSAPKANPKEQRSSLIYLYNNPVEKKLCKRAVEDRWTFLAYAQGDFPFSKKLIKRNVRYALRTSADIVDREAAAGRYLRPALLRELFQDLTPEEREQLTDYIIQRYQFINFDEAISRFDSYNAMLIAADASSGKEFDVGEEFDPTSDVAYREMAKIAAKNGLFDDWKLLHLDPKEQQRWTRTLRSAGNATEQQIQKFLHSYD